MFGITYCSLNLRLTGVLLKANCPQNGDKCSNEGFFLECSCNFSNCSVNHSSFISNGSIMPNAKSLATVNYYCPPESHFIPVEDSAFYVHYCMCDMG